MELRINTNIFPYIMGFSIGDDKSGNLAAINLPCGANLLYLQSLKDQSEMNLLKKYAENGSFSDDDYEVLLKLFIINTPRTQPPPTINLDFLSHFGVELYNENDKFNFRLMESQLPNIKADTWEYIALDILRTSYTEVIQCFDFGNISINLGAWKSTTNDVQQSLLNSLRSALFFTFIGYLYGDDKALYPSFPDFFENEFFKRVTFIHAIWQSRSSDNEKIEYIPLFDSFFNLQSTTKSNLIKTMQTVLCNEHIFLDDRTMIKKQLIDGAVSLHANPDPQSIALEQSLIKPVVNYIVELQTAEEDLHAAITLADSKLHSQSINRSYYAMMHATKALLEHNNLLGDWVPNELNVSESHEQIVRKLSTLKKRGIINNSYLVDFRYVKQKRWVADYTINQFKDVESRECIKRAEDYIKEVKRVTT